MSGRLSAEQIAAILAEPELRRIVERCAENIAAILDRPVDPLREAAEDFLGGGSHDGPCDNDGDDTQSCTLHLSTYDRRAAALRAALEPPKP